MGKAIGDMDRVTQTSAAGSEESAAAAEKLSRQAISMQQAVMELVALVNGATESMQVHSMPNPVRCYTRSINFIGPVIAGAAAVFLCSRGLRPNAHKAKWRCVVWNHP